MTDNTLWCVNVQGPDDVHACRDRADAARYALWLNLSYLPLYDVAGPHMPTVQAVVAVWPHSPASHAEDLARRDREEPKWTADWRDAIAELAEEILPQPIVTTEDGTGQLAAVRRMMQRADAQAARGRAAIERAIRTRRRALDLVPIGTVLTIRHPTTGTQLFQVLRTARPGDVIARPLEFTSLNEDGHPIGSAAFGWVVENWGRGLWQLPKTGGEA